MCLFVYIFHMYGEIGKNRRKICLVICLLCFRRFYEGCNVVWKDVLRISLELWCAIRVGSLLESLSCFWLSVLTVTISCMDEFF